MNTKLPTLDQVQDAFSSVTGFNPSRFPEEQQLLDFAREIEEVERRLGVQIHVRNYMKTTVKEVVAGMSLPH